MKKKILALLVFTLFVFFSASQLVYAGSMLSVTFHSNGGTEIGVEDYTLTNPSSFASGEVVSSSVIGTKYVNTYDIDSDGDLDIFATDYPGDKLYWFENQDGTYIEHLIDSGQENINGPVAISFADLDGDGTTDVIVGDSFSHETDTGGSILWYKINPDKSFTKQNNIWNNIGATMGVEAVDVDLDGDMDIIAVAYSTGRIYIFRNDGLGVFTSYSYVDAATPQFPYALAIEDLNNDTYPDIVITAVGGDGVYYYLNQQTGLYGARQTVNSTLLNPIAIKVADLDGDGDFDFIASSMEDNRVVWYENNNFAFTEHEIDQTYTGYYAVGVGDLDKDGDLDVIAGAKDSKIIVWYENLGGSTLEFSSPIVIDQDEMTQPMDFQIVDMNQDGYLDVVSANLFSGRVIINYNTRNQYVVSKPADPVKEGYVFKGWYTTETFEENTEFDFSTIITQSLDLYAKWVKTITVTYDSRGGSTISPSVGESGARLYNPESPSKDGYDFAGWVTEDQTPYTFTDYPESDITLYATWNDIEKPVIVGVSDISIKESEFDQFSVPTPNVTDNEDQVNATASFYHQDLVTPYANVEDFLEGIKTEGKGYIIYNAEDSSSNQALPIQVEVTYIDDVAPSVEGIEENQSFARKAKVTISFNEGTATLNGKVVTSGTIISEAGDYVLQVTDASGNQTVIHFSIEGSVSLWWLWLIIILIIIVVLIYIFRDFLKEKFEIVKHRFIECRTEKKNKKE